MLSFSPTPPPLFPPLPPQVFALGLDIQILKTGMSLFKCSHARVCTKSHWERAPQAACRALRRTLILIYCKLFVHKVTRNKSPVSLHKSPISCVWGISHGHVGLLFRVTLCTNSLCTPTQEPYKLRVEHFVLPYLDFLTSRAYRTVSADTCVCVCVCVCVDEGGQ